MDKGRQETGALFFMYDIAVMQIKLVHPLRYQKQAHHLRGFLLKADPFEYISHRTGLTGLGRITIIHRPLKYSAEFKMPVRIYIDLRQPVNYCALSIAHEYSHLLLRHHNWGKRPGIFSLVQRYGRGAHKYNYTMEGAVEQVLAILLQLSYEDRYKIRCFSAAHAQKLMKIMGVWPVGRVFLKRWPIFLKGSSRLLPWLKKNFSGS